MRPATEIPRHGKLDGTDLLPLHRLLDEMAATAPAGPAFRFLTDGERAEETLDLRGLAARARALAAALARRGARRRPVLLVHPPGLDFLAGLFACWYADAVAVPCYPPRGSRHRQRLEGIVRDSGAELALAPAGTGIPGVALVTAGEDDGFPLPAVARSTEPCLLQYTSGSTARPKGVAISHANFRGHFAALRPFREMRLKSAVSWLPPYHDMGLVLKILYAFEAGIPLTFFAPEQFIQRPVRWLRAISRFRAELSGAPNFAFDLCLRSIRDNELDGLDLSCWRAAPCGAERVRAETLDRFAARFAPYGFRPEAFLPGYGLAEATLVVTAQPHGLTAPRSRALVSSGTALPGVQLRVADPRTGATRGEGETGEIRVGGPAVAAGYWQRPEETAATFGAELRTGDLGFLERGHLYVTGRIKDLIVIDGANFSPEDIEAAVMAAVPAVVACAAFPGSNGARETVALAVESSGADHAAVCREARRAIGERLELPVGRVVIVRAGLLPRTTSGKIRRAACREALEGGALRLLADDSEHAPAEAAGPALRRVLELVARITGRAGVRADDDPLAFGMGSMDITRLATALREETGAAISLGELFGARSMAEIARMLDRAPGPEISPAEMPGVLTLTHSQERMWFLHQLDPASAAYHVFGAVELRGPLDVRKLTGAVRHVVSRHEILRSRYATEDGRPRVWLDDGQEISLERAETDGEEGLQRFLTRFARAPFALATAPAIRACLVAAGPERHVLGVCAHHIVADGWSLRLLAEEIAAGYGGVPVNGHAPSHAAHAARHRRWVNSAAVKKQVDYWKTRLAGHPGVIRLPTDFPAPAVPTADGAAVRMDLAAELCNRVAAFAKARRATPFMVHLAAFFLLLRNHGAGDDAVVAVPVANRNHPGTAGLIGTLVNTLPFRMTLDPAESFSALLERVRLATLEMHAAQDAPFEKIIGAVKPGRSRDRSPLAQVMCDHQEIPLAEAWPGGVECRPYDAHRGSVQFDLSLLLKSFGDRQQLSLEYRTQLFQRETALAMLHRQVATLERACLEPDRPLAEISSLTDDDRAFLERVSDGPARPAGGMTPALVAASCAIHAGRTAIVCGTEETSYAALESRASAIAAGLRARGVAAGDRVGILLDRDADLPAALLAIWKCGAAYVPLDRANPPERLAHILADQEPMHLLVSPGATACLPADTRGIALDDLLPGDPADFTAHATIATDTAYVIYTSGSTGKPKGVAISHGALANFLTSMAETPGFTAADRLLAVTTISFDISALEIFLPLIMGGVLDLATSDMARDGAALLARLETTPATVMQATPATWRMLAEAGWKGSPDLKILCGGEALDLLLAAQLRPLGCQLWNLYGPTETTVWSTLWQVPRQPRAVRIGRPIANTGTHVLRDGRPVPPGTVGELWITGSGLADGYWHRPDLTAGSFVILPDGQWGYATGDLARWHPDGTLECLGRSDNQLKIRGFRVEPGEIEAALVAHPAVTMAKAALRGKLVAWVTCGGEVTAAELREFLAGRLPAYMIPAEIGVIGTFPLGASGKIDVSTLESPAEPRLFDGPLTPTEEKLAGIWAELLERPAVGKNDDWFHIGGHSLLALRLFARIRSEWRRRLALSAILEHPTLQGLAMAIDRSPPEAPDSRL